MCLPNNLFLATVKTSSQRKKKKNCKFYNRNMVVIRTATNHVALVSATAD